MTQRGMPAAVLRRANDVPAASQELAQAAIRLGAPPPTGQLPVTPSLHAASEPLAAGRHDKLRSMASTQSAGGDHALGDLHRPAMATSLASAQQAATLQASPPLPERAARCAPAAATDSARDGRASSDPGYESDAQMALVPDLSDSSGAAPAGMLALASVPASEPIAAATRRREQEYDAGSAPATASQADLAGAGAASAAFMSMSPSLMRPLPQLMSMSPSPMRPIAQLMSMSPSPASVAPLQPLTSPSPLPAAAPHAPPARLGTSERAPTQHGLRSPAGTWPAVAPSNVVGALPLQAMLQPPSKARLPADSLRHADGHSGPSGAGAALPAPSAQERALSSKGPQPQSGAELPLGSVPDPLSPSPCSTGLRQAGARAILGVLSRATLSTATPDCGCTLSAPVSDSRACSPPEPTRMPGHAPACHSDARVTPRLLPRAASSDIAATPPMSAEPLQEDPATAHLHAAVRDQEAANACRDAQPCGAATLASPDAHALPVSLPLSCGLPAAGLPAGTVGRSQTVAWDQL